VARPAQVPQSEVELEEFFDLSIDPLSIIAFDGEFKRVNASFLRLLGYSEPELFSRTALDIVHPDDVEPAREALMKLAEGHDLVGFEGRIICADGSVRWLEWNAQSMLERGVVYCVGRDTTERRRVEADLREAQRSLEASRDELRVLAEEQAALRRVATLVAKEASPAEVFAKVAEEAANVLGEVECALLRDEGDGTARTVAAWGARMSAAFPVGTRVPVGADGVLAFVVREGRPHRIDDYSAVSESIAEGARQHGIGSAVGCPMMVGGGIWGAMVAASFGAEPCPPETESDIVRFADLVATAIANAEARNEVGRLAAEQAALRRVATLVAEGAPPTAVFDAVAAEMEELLGADRVSVSRYEPSAEIAVLAHRGSGAELVPTGSRLGLEGNSVQDIVWRTERPARMDSFREAQGPIAEVQRAMGVRGAVAVPVVVDGRVWGVIGASWVGDASPPVDTEERMAQFAGLLETAIANADSRRHLDASRARLVTEADEARRRVVRDLHDGAQQGLVSMIMTLKIAERALREGDGEAVPLVSKARELAEQADAELRELAHGIFPSALTEGGLRAGVGAVVSRLDLDVRVDIPGVRFRPEIEASAYLIVAEALTNVVKHANAEHARVTASVEDGTLFVEVRDDGIGGADPKGHGLVGLGDRATALGGRLRVKSPPGGGTILAATLPLPTG
jgi:PAS domain S-box-containing protein